MPVFLSVVGPTGGADGRTCVVVAGQHATQSGLFRGCRRCGNYLRRPSHPYAAPYHEAGDTLALPPVELAGQRNRRYFDRRAALHGEERAVVAAAADTLYYNKVVEAEPWMRASELSLTVDCEFEDCCDVRPLAALDLGATCWFNRPKPKAVRASAERAEQIAVREPVLKPVSEYKPIRATSLCAK